jgi:hypothetical protein
MWGGDMYPVYYFFADDKSSPITAFCTLADMERFLSKNLYEHGIVFNRVTGKIEREF